MASLFSELPIRGVLGNSKRSAHSYDMLPLVCSKGRSGAVLRNIGIGCSGLLVVFILLAILVNLIGGGEQDTATTPPAENEKAGEKPTAEKKKKEAKKKEEKVRESAVGVGQPVDVGEVQWTAANVDRTGQLSQEGFGQFGKTKQGDFVVADLLFTNNGNEPATLTANSVALLDANSREFRPDTDTFGYIAPEQNILLEQVNPGVTREGRVIFSVSPDASGFVLRLGDASVLGNQTGFVDLGF